MTDELSEINKSFNQSEELNKSDTDKGKVVFSILPKDPTDEELQDFINNLTGKDPADNDKK